MPDMEKVIKGLEVIKQFFEYGLLSTAEMFDSYYGILNDAQKLLKKQNEIIQEMLCEKADMLNDKTAALQIELQTQEIRKLVNPE